VRSHWPTWYSTRSPKQLNAHYTSDPSASLLMICVAAMQFAFSLYDFEYLFRLLISIAVQYGCDALYIRESLLASLLHSPARYISLFFHLCHISTLLSPACQHSRSILGRPIPTMDDQALMGWYYVPTALQRHPLTMLRRHEHHHDSPPCQTRPISPHSSQ
jgi:hypothetical protein